MSSKEGSSAEASDAEDNGTVQEAKDEATNVKTGVGNTVKAMSMGFANGNAGNDDEHTDLEEVFAESVLKPLPDIHYERRKNRRERPRVLPDDAYFDDKKRIIDFVIMYKKAKKLNPKKDEMRKAFEKKLMEHGLELEYEPAHRSNDGKTIYIKVHATFEALCQQAEFDNFRMPIARSDLPPKKPGLTNRLMNKIPKWGNPFSIPEDMRIEKHRWFADVFDRNDIDKFIVQDEEIAFTPQQRVNLTFSIIKQARVRVMTEKKQKKFGLSMLSRKSKQQTQTTADEDTGDERAQEAIENWRVRADEESAGSANGKRKGKMVTVTWAYLVSNQAYSKGFALHDSHPQQDHVDYSKIPVEKWPLRKYLYETWARPRMWHTYQPQDQIRDYFGEKIAMYFAWLGLYTYYLIMPSLLGVLVVLIGFSSSNAQSAWWCDENQGFNSTVFCRPCADVVCQFKTTKQLCGAAKINFVFEHFGSMAYAIFMSIWAVVFMEAWQRRQLELATLWDVPEDDEDEDQQVRIDYLLNVTTKRYNPVTKKMEPRLSDFQEKARIYASIATVLFFLSIVIALMIAVMQYKIFGPVLWANLLGYKDKEGNIKYRFNPLTITSLTGSLANGLCIATMNKIYMKVAKALTKMEMRRTDLEFEHSYTYKVVLFQAINFYGALFYMIFYRPLRSQYPLGETLDEGCPETGCLMDVAVQLLIIMTGKQVINNLLELGQPLMRNLLRRRAQTAKLQKKAAKLNKMAKASGVGVDLKLDDDDEEDIQKKLKRWEADAMLDPLPEIDLFGDYLEMLLQYGFVFMFAAAMPLAPLFALLNNVMEIRLDAFKQITQSQRPVPVRVANIQPWFNLLDTFTKIAVFTNGWLISFGMSIIDQMVWSIGQRDGYWNVDYHDFQLTAFETHNWCYEYDEKYNRLDLDRTYTDEELNFCDGRVRLLPTAQGLPQYMPPGLNITDEVADVLVQSQNDTTGLEFLQEGFDVSALPPNETIHYFIDNIVYRLVEKCYVRGYLDVERNFIFSIQWYFVMTGKLLFLIIFEHTLKIIQGLIAGAVPDVPDAVNQHKQREEYLQRKLFKMNEGLEDKWPDLPNDQDPKSKAFWDVAKRQPPPTPAKPFYLRLKNYLPFFC